MKRNQQQKPKYMAHSSADDAQIKLRIRNQFCGVCVAEQVSKYFNYYHYLLLIRNSYVVMS